jgi:hypothetical protein
MNDGEKEQRATEVPPDQDDGKCYMVCCACELPCGKMSYLVRLCAYLVVVLSVGGVAGGIAAANLMSGEPDGNKCKLDWAPNCLAGKVLAVVGCAVLVGISIIGMYCCCQNCNGDQELSHRKGLVECVKCKAMLFVPPVALHFHCAKCFAPLSLTHEKPHEYPSTEPEPTPKKPTVLGHRVSEPDQSRDIIRSFILKADLNHDGNLSAEEIEQYLKNTAGTPEQAEAAKAILAMQSVEITPIVTPTPVAEKKADDNSSAVTIDVAPKSS